MNREKRERQNGMLVVRGKGGRKVNERKKERKIKQKNYVAAVS